MDWSSITSAVVIAIGSLFTAIIALFVAIYNYRRSNYSIVRVVATSSSGGVTMGRGQYNEFRIVIQNLGIPLHNVGICLWYTLPDGFGSGTFPMKTKDMKTIREGQFAKGAITEFRFATDRFDDNYDGFIRLLTDLKSQHARLILHADQYEMWSLRLHDRLWGLKRRWNRIANWLAERSRREVTTARGASGIKYLFRVPVFDSPGHNLLRFANVVRSSPPRDVQPGWRPQPEPNG